LIDTCLRIKSGVVQHIVNGVYIQAEEMHCCWHVQRW